jgi:phosphate transport system permease protein
MTYDQRNAVVVGLAMGFAVIPIIFAISEDAFSNVPQNLVSGSLALGANRWQTVTRVVLPTASPGIFSAVMIGFGRAVGETMIVLMATGNTPIMDWSPFNGFRTLSANIAVEIPEAPVGGTLYRALFLAALVLFALTFLVNTAAELVRQRLRERYSRL